MRRLIPLLSMVLLFVGCVHCGFSSYPNVRVEYDRVANVNSYADIAISADQEVEIRFSTYGGRIVHRHNDRVIWQAPNEPGSYYVDALVSSRSRSEYDRMPIKVVEFPVSVVEVELLDDGTGGKNARIQVLNLERKRVTDFRVKLLLTNGSGERVAYLGDYQCHQRGVAKPTWRRVLSSRTLCRCRESLGFQTYTPGFTKQPLKTVPC
ncbi:MAG: hypothetical protein ACOX46_03015 [Limnochordia bacterium]